MKVRKARVAGTFYPKDPDQLKGVIKHILSKEANLIDYALGKNYILGGIVPHAGYMYSGYEAIHLYELLRYSQISFDTIVILNPNHNIFFEEDVSIAGSDAWETPLGRVKLDVEFGEKMNLPVNIDPHKNEHSAEVQLPFLQLFLGEGFKILPICMNHQTVDCAEKLARSIIQTNQSLKRKLLVLASSDFSHYISPSLAFKLDYLVIDAICKLDAKQVYQEVKRHRISVCGFGPIMTLVEYSKMLYEDVKVKVLRQGNSGDITPSDSVVDYLSILFYRPKLA